MIKKQLVKPAAEVSKKEYPEAICSLGYRDPLQLLISTRLSVQCIDARVNLVMPALFARFPTLEAFTQTRVEEIEELIRSCRLYKTKARDALTICKKFAEEYDDVIPDTAEELTKLPGVGRKTTNLMAGGIYHKPAVITDTHYTRIAGWLGLTESRVLLQVEKDLRVVLSLERSNDFCHRLVLHGRAACQARTAHCEICCMNGFCKTGVLEPAEPKVKK